MLLLPLVAPPLFVPKNTISFIQLFFPAKIVLQNPHPPFAKTNLESNFLSLLFAFQLVETRRGYLRFYGSLFKEVVRRPKIGGGGGDKVLTNIYEEERVAGEGFWGGGLGGNRVSCGG